MCRRTPWTPQPSSSCGTLHLSSSSMASTRGTRYMDLVQSPGWLSCCVMVLWPTRRLPTPHFIKNLPHRVTVYVGLGRGWETGSASIQGLISPTGSGTQIINFWVDGSYITEQCLLSKPIHVKIARGRTYLDWLESRFVQTMSSWKEVLSEERRALDTSEWYFYQVRVFVPTPSGFKDLRESSVHRTKDQWI